MDVQLIIKLALLKILLFLSACELPILNHVKLSEYNQSKLLSHGDLQYIDGLGIWAGLDWVSGPFGSPVNESVFELRLFDSSGDLTSLPEATEIVHYGWMPYMGHGTADDGLLLSVYPGLYRSEDFYFNMPGLWDIHFRFKQNGNLIHEVVFRYNF